MVRDPRDIVVSSYFSHRYSHPTGAYPGLENLRSTLHSVSRDEGLMIELQRRGQQFRQMECWDYGQKNVLEVRMEDVTSDPVRWLHEIMDFVGLYGKHGIGSKMLGDVAAENDFRVYTGGRSPGEEEVGSHYRRGVPGDWRVHLGPEHIDYFKQHYNPLLLKLGYEQSPDWT
jgi:hypothetical protein